MLKDSNRAVTYTVQIIEGSDNRNLDNQGPAVSPNSITVYVCGSEFSWCDFLCWTPKDIIVERIAPT